MFQNMLRNYASFTPMKSTYGATNTAEILPEKVNFCGVVRRVKFLTKM